MLPSSNERFERFVRHAPLAAAGLAALAALPGLTLPFLADDWGLLADAARGSLTRTPFGYFRPLTALSFRAELLVWGTHPFFFHLTNLALAAVCAALLVIVLRRLTGDAALAAGAGALFALHPYHVENVWWVAGRADLLAGVFLLSAMIAYDSWRSARRALPVATILLFEAALLSKEAAISFPVLLIFLGFARPERRLERSELMKGILPLLALALLHGLVVRRLFLGETAFAPLEGTAVHWTGNLFAFVAGSLLPLHTEFLEGRPFLYGSLVLGGFALMLSWAFRNERRIAWPVFASSLAFLILLAPSLLSFQERYLYLPSAALAVGLVLLGRALPPWGRRAFAAGLAIVWLGSLAWHAIAWSDAGRASARLIEDLKEASLPPGTGGILVANMPHRIHGVAVAANFQEAVVLAGGREVPIKAASALDFPGSWQDGLAGGLGGAVTPVPGGVEVRLEAAASRFSRVVLPLPGQQTAKDAGGEWETFVEGRGRLRVRFPSLPGSSSRPFVWSGGRLRPLGPPPSGS